MYRNDPRKHSIVETANKLPVSRYLSVTGLFQLASCVGELHNLKLMLDAISVVSLFLLSMKMQSPVVLDNVSQPCLEILYHIIKPEAPTSKKHKVGHTRRLKKNMSNNVFNVLYPLSCSPFSP